MQNNTHLQFSSTHPEDITVLDILDLVNIWNDTLRHLRWMCECLVSSPGMGWIEAYCPGMKEVISTTTGFVEDRISGYSLKSFRWLEGESETKLRFLTE